jgi:hypothetical protein
VGLQLLPRGVNKSEHGVHFVSPFFVHNFARVILRKPCQNFHLILFVSVSHHDDLLFVLFCRSMFDHVDLPFDITSN